MNNYEENLFLHQSEMMEKIAKIGSVPQVKLISADFVTGQISVMTETLYNKKLRGEQPTFEEVVASLEFLRISENFSIKQVNFLSGEILAEWYEDGTKKIVLGELTQEELNFLKNNQKITAIKKVRERTNCDLVAAKTMVEKAELALALRYGKASYRPRYI